MPGANFSRISLFEIRDPDLPLRYATFMALRLRQMKLLAKTVHGPVLRSHNVLRMRKITSAFVAVGPKSFTTIVLGDHDFPLSASNFGKLTAFGAILAIFSLRMRRNGHL